MTTSSKSETAAKKDVTKLQRAIVDGLEDVKAQDIAVFNTEDLSPLFERVVLASGTSNRQTKALAASVRDAVRERGGAILSVEGEDNGEWIIVDCGAAVVHIMQPAIRQYYHLEEIWGTKPVRMKMGNVQRGLVKASEPEDEDGDDAPAGATSVPAAKPAARRRAGSAAEAKAPAARKAPARKAAVTRSTGSAGAVKTAKPAGKTTARKAPARKTAGAAPAAAVPVVVVPPPKSASKAAAKTAGKTAGKTAARKAPARKPKSAE